MIYPPTKVYFIRLISFSPSIQKEATNTVKFYNFPLKGKNTESVRITDNRNKPIFINFWATWCPPCIAEMPSMKKLYEDYKDKVDFYFVTQENWDVVDRFYSKKEYNFPTYGLVTKTPKELTSSSLPSTYIVDKQGNILVDKKGAANWNSQRIRQLLDDLSSE